MTKKDFLAVTFTGGKSPHLLSLELHFCAGNMFLSLDFFTRTQPSLPPLVWLVCALLFHTLSGK